MKKEARKEQLFGLTTTSVDHFSSSQQRLVYEKNEASLFNANFCAQGSDKVFSTRTVIPQHSNRRFRHLTLQLDHQRRQFFEHDRQHVNNVTRVAISESEDFER